MEGPIVSRRNFLGSSAVASAATISAAAGINPSDLPDLTIKEVKVYVVKAYSHVVSIVTASGIEGNYILPNFESDANATGWAEYAKHLLVGKNALDHPSFTSKWIPKDRLFNNTDPYASEIDICLWDLIGKALGLPVYQILGACRHRLQAYASSGHLDTVEEFVNSVQQAKADGFKCYKIHPSYIPPRVKGSPSRMKAEKDRRQGDYRVDIEVIKAVRKAAGDDYPLMFDRVSVYSRQEALIVGRLLDELKYIAYEDPLPTCDIEGLVELGRMLDVPLHIGELMTYIYDYAEYIRRGAMAVVRYHLANIGGITEGMKLGALAECFSMECAPHNQGEILQQAAHFHCELSMPNSYLFEMPYPQGVRDATYMKDHIRITKDGFVEAPTKPGLGYEIDRNVLDNMTVRIAR